MCCGRRRSSFGHWHLCGRRANHARDGAHVARPPSSHKRNNLQRCQNPAHTHAHLNALDASAPKFGERNGARTCCRQPVQRAKWCAAPGVVRSFGGGGERCAAAVQQKLLPPDARAAVCGGQKRRALCAPRGRVALERTGAGAAAAATVPRRRCCRRRRRRGPDKLPAASASSLLRAHRGAKLCAPLAPSSQKCLQTRPGRRGVHARESRIARQESSRALLRQLTVSSSAACAAQTCTERARAAAAAASSAASLPSSPPPSARHKRRRFARSHELRALLCKDARQSVRLFVRHALAPARACSCVCACVYAIESNELTPALWKRDASKLQQAAAAARARKSRFPVAVRAVASTSWCHSIQQNSNQLLLL